MSPSIPHFTPPPSFKEPSDAQDNPITGLSRKFVRTTSKSKQSTQKSKSQLRRKSSKKEEVDDDEEGAVWIGYLEVADAYDQDMIAGFKHSIDGLLILAGLFSTIVATLVTQTYQSLKSNREDLGLTLQLEQIELLRLVVGNSSSVPSSSMTTNATYSAHIDVWVNGLFFTSLALSMGSALLGGLVRQWLQSYLSHVTGSAKSRAIARQFRFDGVRKWKLAQIVGTLPLLLHLAFIAFFGGLSLFVYDLHPTMAIPVIACTALATLLYLVTAVLPTLWLDCPYRVPFLFRLFKPVVSLLIKALRCTQTAIIPTITATITKRRTPKLPTYTPPATVLTPMRNAEYEHLSGTSVHMTAVARSLDWLVLSSRENELLASEAIKATILSKGLDESGRPQPWFHSFLNICPLHVAISWGLFIMTRKPVERADPAYRAADWPQFFDLLRASNRLPENFLNMYLGELVETGSRDITTAEQLISWGAIIENSGVLAKAVAAGDLRFLSFIAGHASQFRDSTQVDTVFSQVASRGNLDVARVFVEKGIPISNHVVEAAYCSGNHDMTEFLLENGAQVPNLGRVLPLLPERLHDQFVHLFLDYGALPNPTDEIPAYDSPLVWETQEGNLDMVKLLIEKGADINSAVFPFTKKSGLQEYFTALGAAAELGHLDILSTLLAHGANVDPDPVMVTPGPYGGTSQSFEVVPPLLQAALNGQIAAAEILIKNGANVQKVLEMLDEQEEDESYDETLMGERPTVRDLLVKASTNEDR